MAGKCYWLCVFSAIMWCSIVALYYDYVRYSCTMYVVKYRIIDHYAAMQAHELSGELSAEEAVNCESHTTHTHTHTHTHTN